MNLNKLREILNWMKKDFKQPVNPTFVRAQLTLIFAGFLATFFYFHGSSLDHGKLFDLKLGMTLAIVEVPLLMFTPILYKAILDDSRKHAEEAKRLEDIEKHTQDLIDKIYNKLLLVQIHRVHNNKLGLLVERFDESDPNRFGANYPADYLWIPISNLPRPQFDMAMKHLEDYENILQFWNQAENIVKQFNESAEENRLEQTREEIRIPLLEFRNKLYDIVNDLNAGIPLKGTCRRGF